MKHIPKWVIPSFVTLVILGAVGAAYLLSRPQTETVSSTLQITATKTDPQGLPADSAFALSGKFRMQEAQIRELLEIEPPIEYALAGANKAWTLTPTAPLAENTVYTFRVLDETGKTVQSFAFQTKSDLMVGRVYPGDGMRSVPVETGIELGFNAPDVDVSSYFSILPELAGQFETNGNTVRFIPSAPLEPNSIYRVTLRAGLTAPNGMQLKEDLRFSFETMQGDGTFSYERLQLMGDYAETFLPGDPLAVSLQMGKEQAADVFSVQVHRFPDISAYLRELQAYEAFYAERYGAKTEYVAATAGLEEVTAYEGSLLPQDGYGYAYLAMLPDTLEVGHYLVTISGKDAQGEEQLVQKLIQLQNLSVYTQSMNGETLIWLNDPLTGSAMAEVEVRLLSADEGKDPQTFEGVTDAAGVLRLKTGDAKRGYMHLLRDGKLVFTQVVTFGQTDQARLSERYYTVLYTDRTIYRPEDTIRFWGMVRPRKAGGAIPRQVTLELLDVMDERNALERVRVEVGADGVFSGELPFGGMRSEWYNLALTDGEPIGKDESRWETAYDSFGISISEYEKPPYVIEVSQKSDYYFADEPVDFAVSAHFFDGTPVSDGQLRLSSYEMLAQDSDVGLLQLDEKGTATRELPPIPVPAEIPDWHPRGVWYEVRNERAEELYTYMSGWYTYLPSVVTAQTVSEEPGKLTIRTGWLDVEKLDRPMPEKKPDGKPYTEFTWLSQAGVDLPFTVQIYRTTYTQVPTGSYYDYVNRKTITRYRTEPQEELIDTVVVKDVIGGTTMIDYPYENDRNTAYRAEVLFDGGVIGTVRATYYGPTGGHNPSEDAVYRFAVDGVGADEKLALGETGTLRMTANNQPFTGEGRALYTLAQRELLEVGEMTPSEGVPFEMQERFMPNIRMAGAYFDGRHVFAVNESGIQVDGADRALALSVTPDKEEYRPGEQVKLAVEVKDAAGAPVAAEVAIGVVDEAVFAVSEQQIDLLDSLYGAIYYPPIRQRSSYQKYSLMNEGMATGGKGGGGGGGTVQTREIFRDTAAFLTLKTDATGKGEATFTLPDNVTGWRLTAVGVTDAAHPQAGQLIGQTVATLPFYLTHIVTDRYLVGDDLALSVQAVGTALAPPSEPGMPIEPTETIGSVDYTAAVYNSAEVEIDRLTASGQPGERVHLNFGKYDAGQYTLALTASAGETFSDAVRLPVAVVEQGLLVNRIENMPLDELQGVVSARWPIDVMVYDKRMEPFMEGLQKLSTQGGERTEVLAAAYLAERMHRELGENPSVPPVVRDDRLDQLQEESGVRALPSGDPEAEVTAKLLVAAPELVRKPQALEYLSALLQDPAATQADRVYAELGLAALGEPVLLDLERMLAEEGLTPAERLYLGVGLAKLGDYTGAEKVYAAYAAQMVREGALKSLDFGGTLEERIADTAAALMLTSITANPDADGLMRYLNLQGSSRRAQALTLCNLEQLTYLVNFTLPTDGVHGKFTYQRDGEKQTVTLDENGIAQFQLTEKQLAEAAFKGGEGIWASVRTLAPAAFGEVSDSKVKITKQYTTAWGEAPKVGDQILVMLHVQFAPDAPYGCYLLSDLIPSGMRYMPIYGGGKANMGFEHLWSRLEQEGQTVRGYIYRTRPGEPEPRPLGWDAFANPGTEEPAEEREYLLSYFISGTIPGDYITESAYLTPETEGVLARSPRGKIQVNAR